MTIISTIISLVLTGTWLATITYSCSLNASATGDAKLVMRCVREEKELQARVLGEIQRRYLTATVSFVKEWPVALGRARAEAGVEYRERNRS
jgi:hypothetical protein